MKLQQDLASGYYKNTDWEETTDLLGEKILRQEEQIRRLKKVYEKIQKMFWEAENERKRDELYLKVFDNGAKLERMRYDVPY